MSPSRLAAPIILVLWLIAAVVAVGNGLLYRTPFPPPLFVAFGVLFAFLCLLLVPGVAAWVGGLDLRAILGFHLVRFVGIYFLWLMGQGRLDPDFARQAGIGDIVTALGAVLLLIIPAWQSKRGFMIWNIVGFGDILLVVTKVAWGVSTTPAGFTELFTLPLGLLPAFFVPLIIVSHIVVFFRLKRMSM